MKDKLVTKANDFDTKTPNTNVLVVTKIQHDSEQQVLRKISDFNKKISNISGMVKKADDNMKVTKSINKIPSFTGLVTTAVINKKASEIESKYLISLLGLKNCSDTKNTEVESKIPGITTFNRLTKRHFDARMK